MSGKQYSSSDAFVISFIREVKDVDVVTVGPDPQVPRRNRVTLAVPDDVGKGYEIEYRNSEYRRYVLMYQDTVDLIKRR